MFMFSKENSVKLNSGIVTMTVSGMREGIGEGSTFVSIVASSQHSSVE